MNQRKVARKPRTNKSTLVTTMRKNTGTPPPNYGVAYCTAPVSKSDATFPAVLTETFPDTEPGDAGTAITVVNPLDNLNSADHGYVLKENDLIAVEQWTGGQWKIYDGPCNSNFTETENPPTGIVLSNDSVDEDSPGQVIGSLTATDADLPDDSHTFKIIGSDHGMEIVSDNVLRVKTDAGLDSADSPRLLEIMATDSGGRQYQESFEITINSVAGTGRFALREVDPVITEPPTQLAGVQTWTYYGLPEESIPNNFIWRISGADRITSGDTVTMLIKNRGAATLTISDIAVSGDLFSSTNKTSTTIAAGAEETITITCLTGVTTTDSSPYSGTITFTHDGDAFGMSSPFVYNMTHWAVDDGPVPVT